MQLAENCIVTLGSHHSGCQSSRPGAAPAHVHSAHAPASPESAISGAPMTDLPAALTALAHELGPDAVHTDEASLTASSHDTWPVATKARQGLHPHQADVVVKARTRPTSRRAARGRGDGSVTTRALGSSVTGQPLPTAAVSSWTSPACRAARDRRDDMTVTFPPASTAASWRGAPGGGLDDALLPAVAVPLVGRRLARDPRHRPVLLALRRGRGPGRRLPRGARRR